jgi:hypothetical protein
VSALRQVSASPPSTATAPALPSATARRAGGPDRRPPRPTGPARAAPDPRGRADTAGSPAHRCRAGPDRRVHPDTDDARDICDRPSCSSGTPPR